MRGCFGTSEIEDEQCDLKNRPQERRKVNGIKRNKNYIYKVEELNAAKKIVHKWREHKLKKNKRNLRI